MGHFFHESYFVSSDQEGGHKVLPGNLALLVTFTKAELSPKCKYLKAAHQVILKCGQICCPKLTEGEV